MALLLISEHKQPFYYSTGDGEVLGTWDLRRWWDSSLAQRTKLGIIRQRKEKGGKKIREVSSEIWGPFGRSGKWGT